MNKVKSTKEIKSMFNLKIQLLKSNGFHPSKAETNLCELLVYLDLMSCKLMNNASLFEFREVFTGLYNKAYNKRKGYDAKHSYNIHKINNIFIKNQLPYRLLTDMVGCHIIVDDLN